jgi:hypothetical protein
MEKKTKRAVETNTTQKDGRIYDELVFRTTLDVYGRGKPTIVVLTREETRELFREVVALLADDAVEGVSASEMRASEFEPILLRLEGQMAEMHGTLNDLKEKSPRVKENARMMAEASKRSGQSLSEWVREGIDEIVEFGARSERLLDVLKGKRSSSKPPSSGAPGPCAFCGGKAAACSWCGGHSPSGVIGSPKDLASIDDVLEELDDGVTSIDRVQESAMRKLGATFDKRQVMARLRERRDRTVRP